MVGISDMKRVLLLSMSAAMVLAIIGVSGCAADESPTIEAPEPAAPVESDATVPETDSDRVLVESKCSQCHALDRVWDASMDRSGWETTVRRMEANGLSISDEERARIVDYLSEQ